MQLNPSEISELIKAKIETPVLERAAHQGTIVPSPTASSASTGRPMSASGEMIEMPGNTFGVALNLERDSVGAVILGDYEHIKEGDAPRTAAF
jgi:F-type H+-transporting ATPase subunit alpha